MKVRHSRDVKYGANRGERMFDNSSLRIWLGFELLWGVVWVLERSIRLTTPVPRRGFGA